MGLKDWWYEAIDKSGMPAHWLPFTERALAVDADITSIKADAVVNAANSHLMNAGGVARAIEEAAGETIKFLCQQAQFVEPGDATWTPPGDLKKNGVKGIIHAVTMEQPGGRTDAKIIQKATQSALEAADKLEYTSIALPAFGTGVGGFDMEKCAEIMVGTTHNYLRNNKKSKLRNIYFVAPKSADADIFDVEVLSYGKTKKGEK